MVEDKVTTPPKLAAAKLEGWIAGEVFRAFLTEAGGYGDPSLLGEGRRRGGGLTDEDGRQRGPTLAAAAATTLLLSLLLLAFAGGRSIADRRGRSGEGIGGEREWWEVEKGLGVVIALSTINPFKTLNFRLNEEYEEGNSDGGLCCWF